MSWEIEYFELSSGEQPAETFEDRISKKLRGKLIRLAEKVAEDEGTCGGGYWEPCRGFSNLFEIRAIFGGELGRYYSTVDGNRLVILDGFQKRPGHGTPASVFRTADQYRQDYCANHRVSPELPENEREGNE